MKLRNVMLYLTRRKKGMLTNQLYDMHSQLISPFQSVILRLKNSLNLQTLTIS